MRKVRVSKVRQASYHFLLPLILATLYPSCSTQPCCLQIRDMQYSPGCKGDWIRVDYMNCREEALVALYDDRLYFTSVDQGNSWTISDQATLYPFGITDWGCQPKNSSVRYRIVGQDGLPTAWDPEFLERTDDGGKTWFRKKSSLANGRVSLRPRELYLSAFDVNTLFMRPVDAIGNNGKETFCVSHDGGDTFEPILSLRGHLFAVSRSNPDILYAADQECNTFRSNDQGKTWNAVSEVTDLRAVAIANAVATGVVRDQSEVRGSKCADLTIDPKDPDVVYLVTEFGILKTVDGGKQWCGMAPRGLAGSVGQLLVDLRDSRVLFLGTGCGLYRSLDGGCNWDQLVLFKER